MIRNKCTFGMVTDAIIKQLEYSKETYYIFVNIGYDISVTNGTLITTEGKQNVKCKRHKVACDRAGRTHSLAP
jgi:hypothetical protein